MKKYYYIAVKTNHGCTFVTSINNASRSCLWKENEKPLAMSKKVAEDVTWGLNLNGSYAFVVESVINPISDQFLITN